MGDQRVGWPYLERTVGEGLWGTGAVWTDTWRRKEPRLSTDPKGVLQTEQTLWYIYAMEYYSAIKKNSFESIWMRWVSLEPIVQSEVSQKEKDKYCIWRHVYGLSIHTPVEWWTSTAGQQWRGKQRMDLWVQLGEGEAGTNWESSMETYTLPYVK